ncbi:hypothetical protein AX16_000250 [Volvariella volvacea WC 439]|nr:hypothetical protein AX16_000250 [Volvariella volvacea WC 439]
MGKAQGRSHGLSRYGDAIRQIYQLLKVAMVGQADPKKSTASKPKKRFVGTKSQTPSKPGITSVLSNQIPPDILHDERLNAAINQLPPNYSFEIHKTIYHIRKNNATMVALQMPEGLQMFACAIADIIETFTNALTVIMGDVTYGACCIDDYTAVALGCDMLIHYGHSCLVPMDQTSVKTLYVFVEIAIDSEHLAQSVRLNFPDTREAFQQRSLANEATTNNPTSYLMLDAPPDDGGSSLEHGQSAGQNSPTRLALVSTIQFVAALQRLKEDLNTEELGPKPIIPTGLLAETTDSRDITGLDTVQPSRDTFYTGKYDVTIPRSKPLSPGEILGCTAPRLGDVDALIYLGDGRFHLESIMIANPFIPAFRYDPYSKKLTRERYNHREMQSVRAEAVNLAKKSITAFTRSGSDSDTEGRFPPWGVILGTLGRQGSFKQLQAITAQLEACKTPIPYVPILLSELSPAKLSFFNPHISTFVQTSCPRLSIDWGYAFDRPLLSPYETAVAVGQRVGWTDGDKGSSGVGTYPMDFYEAGTPWAISRVKGTI